MRKIKVQLTVEMTMTIDDGVEVGEVIQELDYDFTDQTTKATIEDTEILDYDVVDSK